MGLPVPTYKIPLARLQPITEEEEHTYDTIERENSIDRPNHTPITRGHIQTVEIGNNRHAIDESEWDDITDAQIHIHQECGAPSQHFINEHFEDIDFSEILDDTSQPAYNLLESIREEPEIDDEKDGVHDLECNHHTYQVLERNEDGFKTHNHEGQSDIRYPTESDDFDDGNSTGGDMDAGERTPEEYETPVHSKFNGRKNEEDDDVGECTTEAPIRSKLNIHVHVSACTH